MSDFSQPHSLTSKELEPSDRQALLRARQIGLVGLICAIAGGTGVIASAEQTTWDIAKTTYLVLAAMGCTGLIYGEKTFRKLMKKYLRPFSLISLAR